MKEAIVLKTFPVYTDDGRMKDLSMGTILKYDEILDRYRGTSDDNTVCTLPANLVENPDNSKYFYIGPSIPKLVDELIREVIDKHPTKTETEIHQEILNYISTRLLEGAGFKTVSPLTHGADTFRYDRYPCSCGNDGTKPCWSTACPNRLVVTYTTR